MSTQELDVKRSWQAIRRHRSMVAAAALAGILGGVTFGLINPPMRTATSLVVLPPPPASPTASEESTQSISTQVFIARSEPVLRSAGQNVDPPLPTAEVRNRVKVSSVTDDVIQIEARGTSARQATTLANAVAQVYLVFVTTDQKLPGDLGKKTGARVLEEATTARGSNVPAHLGIYGILGGLIGAVAGAIAALAITRGDRRLRMRDEIADAVGIPVLASVSSYRPRDVSDWANLFEQYSPTAVDAWSLRKTVHRLGLDMKGGPPVSLSVISFADDHKALPIGAQLAAFATSIGIPTAVAVDVAPEEEQQEEQEEEDPVTAPAVDDDDSAPPAGPQRRLPGDVIRLGGEPGKVMLDVQLLVIDREAPQLAGTLHTTRTVVALSSGTITAEELARLAVAAAADDRTIDGIVLADPDPSDRTIGRVSQSSRRSSATMLPTLLTGSVRRTK